MLFAMSTQNHCEPERAVEGMATNMAQRIAVDSEVR